MLVQFVSKIDTLWQKRRAKLTDQGATFKINNDILSLNGLSKLLNLSTSIFWSICEVFVNWKVKLTLSVGRNNFHCDKNESALSWKRQDKFTYRSCLSLKLFVILMFFLESHIHRILLLQCSGFLLWSPGYWPNLALQYRRLLQKQVSVIRSELRFKHLMDKSAVLKSLRKIHAKNFLF